MALQDVKIYYMQQLEQLVEAKNDLADFTEAVKAGNITEDRLAAVKEEVNQIQVNTDRLAYIMFLLELPKRKSKRKKFLVKHAALLDAFIKAKADAESVVAEDTTLINEITKQLTELTRES